MSLFRWVLCELYLHILTPQLGRWSQAPWVIWCQRQRGVAEGRKGLRGRAAGAGSRVPMAPESSQPGSADIYPRGPLGIWCCSLLPEFLAAQEHPRRKYNHTSLCSCSHTHRKRPHMQRGLIHTCDSSWKSKLNVSWLRWLLFPRQAQKKRVTSAKRCWFRHSHLPDTPPVW